MTTTDLPAAIATAQAWLNLLPEDQCNRPAPIRPSTVAALIDAYTAEASVRRISTADRTTEVEALKERLSEALAVIRRVSDGVDIRWWRLREIADRLDPEARS